MRRRRWAVVAVALLVSVQALAAGPADALPKGAYWYSLWQLPSVWQHTRGAGVVVGVVDSGVQADLGDLRGKVLPGLDLSSAHRGADVDTAKPGEGDFGHGSDMAALIAGTGRGAGLVGVAPDAKILPVNGEGDDHTILDSAIPTGVRWAVDHGARIINLSLGQYEPCPADEAAAIKYAYQHDVIVVASAGDRPGTVGAPANCPGAIAVGGVDVNFTPWTRTPTGPQVAFSAPAFNLVNELLDGTLNGPLPGNAGTSQAAALVSGVFALMRSAFPHDSARQIVTRALYAVHNGLGAGHAGVRVDDRRGYGEIVPALAVTQPLPAGAHNPIYDGFARALGPARPSASPGPSAGSTAASSASAPPSASGDGAADGSGPSNSGVAVTVVVLAAALLLGGVVAVVVVRSRRRAR